MKYDYRIENNDDLREFFVALSGAGVFPLHITIDDKPRKKRSDPMNRSLHLWLRQVSDYLNDAGLDMRMVMKEEFQLSWSPHTVKEKIWRPMQIAVSGKVSTVDADHVDYATTYREISTRLAEKFDLPNFPTWPNRFAVPHKRSI